MTAGAVYRAVAESAWGWVLDQVRGDNGPWLPIAVPEDAEPDPTPTDVRDTVHLGVGGLALLLAEVRLSRSLTDPEQRLSDAVVARHRRDPSLLDAGTTWMQGAAGITAYLFRLARVTDEGLDVPVVDRPDQWWAVPDGVRTSGRETEEPVSSAEPPGR